MKLINIVLYSLGTVSSNDSSSESGAELTCLADKMMITVTAAGFGTAELVANNTQGFDHNGSPCDSTNVSYDSDADSYSFEIEYGACGMGAEMNDTKIHFTHSIKSHYDHSIQGNEDGIILENDTANTINVKCSFSDTVSTDDVTDTPTYLVNRVTTENTVEVEQEVKWEDFDLAFFLTSEFKNEVTDDVDIGTDMFMQATWNNTFSETFPVRYYIDECTVSSGESEFKTISGGCGAEAVETELLSSSAFSYSVLQYKYLSFSFTEGEALDQEQSVICVLKFCLKTDIDNGDCAVSC